MGTRWHTEKPLGYRTHRYTLFIKTTSLLGQNQVHSHKDPHTAERPSVLREVFVWVAYRSGSVVCVWRGAGSGHGLIV